MSRPLRDDLCDTNPEAMACTPSIAGKATGSTDTDDLIDETGTKRPRPRDVKYDRGRGLFIGSDSVRRICNGALCRPGRPFVTVARASKTSARAM